MKKGTMQMVLFNGTIQRHFIREYEIPSDVRMEQLNLNPICQIKEN